MQDSKERGQQLACPLRSLARDGLTCQRRLCRWRRSVCGLTLALALLSLGCASRGPRTVQAEQLAYAEAIANTMERQALRTMVQMRYHDWPLLLNVTQIVAGYTWETESRVSGGIDAPFQPGAGLADISGQITGKQTERPTITYQPVVGEDFVEQLLTPVRPDLLFALMEAGLSADVLLLIAAESVNGYRNVSLALDAPPPDEEFLRFTSLMRSLQRWSAVQLRRKPGEADESNPILQLTFVTDRLPEPLLQELRMVKELLGLEPGLQSYDIAYGVYPTSPSTIRLKTRPTARIMHELGALIDVPAEHLDRTRDVVPERERAWLEFRVRSGDKPPREAAVAVLYRGNWFWIDDRDSLSRDVLDLVLVLLTIAESAQDRRTPIITIPAG